MGWQGAPGPDNQLSSAQVGKHLKHIYEQLLEGFERDSVQNTIDNTYRQRPPAPPASQPAQALSSNTNLTTNTNLNTNLLTNPNTLVSQLMPHAPTPFVNMTLQSCYRLAVLSRMSNDDLMKRVPAGQSLVNQIIEQRPFLQNFAQQYQAVMTLYNRQQQQSMQSQQQLQQQIAPNQPQMAPGMTERPSFNGPLAQGPNVMQSISPMQQSNGAVSATPVAIMIQDAMSRPEVFQQAVRKVAQSKDQIRQALPETGSKVVSDSEKEMFRNIFRELLQTYAEVEKLLPLYLVYGLQEGNLGTILKMVRLFLRSSSRQDSPKGSSFVWLRNNASNSSRLRLYSYLIWIWGKSCS